MCKLRHVIRHTVQLIFFILGVLQQRLIHGVITGCSFFLFNIKYERCKLGVHCHITDWSTSSVSVTSKEMISRSSELSTVNTSTDSHSSDIFVLVLVSFQQLQLTKINHFSYYLQLQFLVLEMSADADNKNVLNFVKIIASLPGTHDSHSKQCTSIALHITRFNVFTCPCQQVNHGSLSTMYAYSVTTDSIPQTENNLSTNACDDGAETKS